MVDFEWYRSFVYIFKYNSVSEAARTRIMTQPAMSQHLASLEAEVGEPLFIRTARKMIPTERGKELYSQLAPLIESLEETSLGFHSASLPTIPQIRIGSAIEYYTESILPQLSGLEAYTVSSFGTADQLLLLLNEDKVDLIVTSQKSQTPGIEYASLCTEQFYIVSPYRLDPPQQMNLRSKEQWLLAQNWISYGLDLPIIRRLWREHFKKRPAIKPGHVIPNLHLIMRAVENGLGLSLIPDYMIRNSMNKDQAKIVLEELNVHNQIFIAYKSKNKHLPAIRNITAKLLGTAVDKI
ncbi:LysR family transcriptional regulator [Paenibacillus sp. HN-1]|uniref:LysR family transcriptional regulator n=1 Tax=Paenibacillus TaxID=44249 RepID=UPI001CA8332E|nr:MULTISPECIES: LysR family transcriptional regulator [Paenibacillus]MBY9080552.1 LysR family transcriptional regulator [Paenibacillus sp. CGMCC 1.18879]MBY9085503.1 LysR family transcriptional regulator [Paenibacillus sinensis]